MDIVKAETLAAQLVDWAKEHPDGVLIAIAAQPSEGEIAWAFAGTNSKAYITGLLGYAVFRTNNADISDAIDQLADRIKDIEQNINPDVKEGSDEV